jgi:hypothetical protein
LGGYGSGRTGGKPIAENCRQIDICRMLRDGTARDGEITAGDLHWSVNSRASGSISYVCDLIDPDDARLTLKFLLGLGVDAERVIQFVRLRYTVPHYGGRRWWLVCPSDQVHVSKLYMPLDGYRFVSRRALGLGYRSQRIAPADKPLQRLFRLRAKLGMERGWNGPLLRPRGMWHRTFACHQVKYVEVNKQLAMSYAQSLTAALVASG